MMYDDQTRRALREEIMAEERLRCGRLTGRDGLLFRAITGSYRREFTDWSRVEDDWAQGLASGRYAAPSDFFRADYREAMEALVPPRHRPAFLTIIDRLNRFQCAEGLCRRTMRTRSYRPHLSQVIRLLIRSSELWYFDAGLEDLLLGRLEEEKLDYLNHACGGVVSPHLLAGELDLGNGAVRAAVEEVLLSDTNTARVSLGLIRGILLSSDREMYEQLGKFLLAARLQEGVRQAICESMDCGTTEAFRALFSVIVDHNLIRFSSVKRAIATWSGLYSDRSLDRLTAKEVTLIQACLEDAGARRRLLTSSDPVEVHMGLWTLGAFEVEDALAAVEDLVRRGDRPQRLAAAYYLGMVEDDALRTRTAASLLRAHPDDLPLAACCLPSYLPQAGSALSEAVFGPEGWDPHTYKELKEPRPLILTQYLPARGSAEEDWRMLEGLYQAVPSKGLCFDPCVFPWHQARLSRMEILQRLVLLAWLLQDRDKLTACGRMLAETGVTPYDGSKPLLMRLVFLSGDGPDLRRALIAILKSGDADSARLAFRLLDRLSLTAEDYGALEDLLASKRDALRAQVDRLLLKQGDAALSCCVERLLSAKTEMERAGGLDLIRQLDKLPGRKELRAALGARAAALLTAPTGRERVLLGELTDGRSEAGRIAQTPGHGICDPAARIPERTYPYDPAKPRRVYTCPEGRLTDLLRALDDLVQNNARQEYRCDTGEMVLLGNEYLRPVSHDPTADPVERLPFPALWRGFYENQIGGPALLFQLGVYNACVSLPDIADWTAHSPLARVFGSGLLIKALPYRFAPVPLAFPYQVRAIVSALAQGYCEDVLPFPLALQAANALAEAAAPQNVIWHGRRYGRRPVYDHPLFRPFLDRLYRWATDEEFTQAFFSLRRLQAVLDRAGREGEPPDQALLTESWYLKAWRMGLISKDAFYREIFTRFGPGNTLAAVTGYIAWQAQVHVRGGYGWYGQTACFECLLPRGQARPTPDAVFALEEVRSACQTIYADLVPGMLQVELTRGDPATVFSPWIASIRAVPGADYLARILTALGDQPLNRGGMYGWGGREVTRQQALTHLLSVSCPAQGETAEDLARALESAGISGQRLVDAAMRAPQWVGLLEEYLGWPGLKSGCYYFIAHMNEFMDEYTRSVVARYTPLTAEELRDGAFDVDWFREVYGLLGPDRFQSLYRSAKYISTGSKHARARKFADAALGRLEVDKTEAELGAKRNQDLLMAYGAIPLAGEEDLLGRYQFLQEFRRESRQFGAQRRASEAAAVDLALKNLSVNAGFSDVTRLTLRAESRLSDALAPCLEWQDVGECSVRIQVDEFGKNALICRRGDKLLKSLPARLGREAQVKALKEVHRQLSDQYSRTRVMLERAMEDRTALTAGEMRALCASPVTGPMVKALVFLHGGQPGFLGPDGLTGPEGEAFPLAAEDEVVLAHPLDLYEAGCWSGYQQDLLQRQVRQPFRQVFRELYLRLPEELEQSRSLLFAGHQLQPKKAMACLRERRWVAEYGMGLQKVCYKADLAACLYALCDWFSPAEVEPPTLEWVAFYNRRTGAPVKLADVPPLIYSEIMRDVDLAVSVAHAGGVDPETSHSTIELRRAILDYNLSLFQLANVELEGSHALVHGKLGEYSVHLGSGVVHQLGGAMLNVLPVHSQARGRLFLPFLDSDPKTAEVLSKILLFARDTKIKDPFILSQLR